MGKSDEIVMSTFTPKTRILRAGPENDLKVFLVRKVSITGLVEFPHSAITSLALKTPNFCTFNVT